LEIRFHKRQISFLVSKPLRCKHGIGPLHLYPPKGLQVWVEFWNIRTQIAIAI